MAKWCSDYATGEIICAICGKPKANRSRCCKTAPYVDYETFKAKMFPGEEINHMIAREFWDDYLSSSYDSLTQYIQTR